MQTILEGMLILSIWFSFYTSMYMLVELNEIYLCLSLCSKGDRVSNRRVELSPKQKERNDLEREVLAALFNADERTDELPRRRVKEVTRSRFTRIVVEPTIDSIVEFEKTAVCSQQHNKNGMHLFPFYGRLLFLEERHKKL